MPESRAPGGWSLAVGLLLLLGFLMAALPLPLLLLASSSNAIVDTTPAPVPLGTVADAEVARWLQFASARQ